MKVTGDTKREQVLVELLDRYRELADPLNGPSGIAGDGDAIVGMPRTYTPSVRELERLMKLMRVEAPSIWWHTNEYFLRPTPKVATAVWKGARWTGLEPHQRVLASPGGWAKFLAKERGRKSGRGTEFRVTIVQWDPAVRLEKVRRGITWLASNWSAAHEPFLPAEIAVAA